MRNRRMFVPVLSGGPSDVTAPTVTITSTESSPSSALPIPITITFSEAVTGFVVGDITVGNGTAGDFATADNIVFTANITPTASGTVTVDIAAGVCTDAAGNENEAATQFSITAVVFTLRDNFTDTRAAGSVDNTAATPGPGTRDVKDTNNKITIGSGYYNMATGSAGNDGMWWDAVARTQGKVLIFEINSTSGNMLAVGWGNASLADTTSCEMRIYSNVLNFYTGTAIAVGVYTNSTNYYLACVLLSTGEYWFVKGGTEYTAWTFLCKEQKRTTDPLYPMIMTQSTTAIFKAATMRVPYSTFLPGLLLYDTFTRADGAIGNSETSGPESQVVTQRTWSGATWTISSNAAVNTPGLGSELATGALTVGTWYSITATEADHFYAGCAVGHTFRATAETALDTNNKVKALTLSELFCTFDPSVNAVAIEVKLGALTDGTQAGIVFGLDSAASPANFGILYWDGLGNIKLDTVTSGTYTNRVSAVIAFSAGDSLVLPFGGSSSNNKVLLKSAAGALSSIGAYTTYPAGTIHGVFSTDAGNTALDVAIYPLGAEGQHAALDSFLA